MRLVAHRGASATAPENTLAALRRARDLGCGWAEVDVQRTLDGVLVLVHDANWQRTAGIDAAVAETPWEAVRAYDVGAWFSSDFAGEPPPRLEAALDLVGPNFQLDIELKNPVTHPGLADAVVDLVLERELRDAVCLTSFDHTCIDRLAARRTGLRLGYISARGAPRHLHEDVRILALGAEGVRAHPEIVEHAHAQGRQVWVWTVDRVEEGQHLAGLGVDALISNRPEALRELTNAGAS